MNYVYDKLQNCLQAVRKQTDFVPKVALVLGSGLGDFASNVSVVARIDYSSLPDFPVSTVSGHAGCFVFGYLEDVPVVVMQGRVHYYEGYEMSDVVLPIRLMGLLGAETIFLTNAAGGLNRNFSQGDLMLITDHVSTLVPSPLRGPNLDELGPRFPDMTDVYTKELREVILATASELDIPLQQGVYVQLSGPNYETPREISLLAQWGIDAVGMSTVCEAMAARHMGKNVCAISCITNMAAGISDRPLSHDELKETADRVKDSFTRLVKESVVRIAAWHE